MTYGPSSRVAPLYPMQHMSPPTPHRPAAAAAAPAAKPPKQAASGMEDEYGAMDRADSFFLLPEFELESGVVLRSVRVAYRTWGTLSASGDNALFVPHALTGNAAVDTWWAALFGEGDGRAFDTARYFVVGANMLGSCYGTTSPLDVVPADDDGGAPPPWLARREGTAAAAAGSRYAASFPHTTVRDNVRLHHALLVHLGVRSVHAVVGGSAGGMQALEWAIMYPRYVQRAVPLPKPLPPPRKTDLKRIAEKSLYRP